MDQENISRLVKATVQCLRLDAWEITFQFKHQDEIDGCYGVTKFSSSQLKAHIDLADPATTYTDDDPLFPGWSFIVVHEVVHILLHRDGDVMIDEHEDAHEFTVNMTTRAILNLMRQVKSLSNQRKTGQALDIQDLRQPLAPAGDARPGEQPNCPSEEHQNESELT